MQNYIRTLYESSSERGHLCPCSTVRDIRSYTNELIKKRHPKLSNKRVMEAANNTITNAGQELQDKQSQSSWKAASVKTEKERIKKFIADALNELMRTPESYAFFKATLNQVPTTSTPKKIPERHATSRRSLNNQKVDIPKGKVVNKKLAMVQQQNETNDPFKTPDRKIKPKVASNSKIVTGMIHYEGGKPIITCPDLNEEPQAANLKTNEHYVQDEIASLDLNASLWLTPDLHHHSDPAESPFNHGCNSIDDSTIEEEDLIQSEFDESLERLDDSIEDISGTPKRGVDLPNLIKRLEQHFSEMNEMNTSLRESSMQHAKRKRADSLSAVQHLIDKFVPENTSPSPPMRKRSNSVKNSTPNLESGPMKAQHILSSSVAVKQPTVQMFNGKCRNLLETFQSGAKTIKMHIEEENAKFNNSMNKLRIDSMFPRMPRYNTPYVPWTTHLEQNGGRKRCDSLNFDSLDSMHSDFASCLEPKSFEASNSKYERKRGISLNLDQVSDSFTNDIHTQKIETNKQGVPKPEGIINGISTLEIVKDLKCKEISRLERINNKIDEIGERIYQMKMNLYRVG